MTTQGYSPIPAEPVHRWIRQEVVPQYGSVQALCRVLAAHTYRKAGAWHQWFMRLPTQTHVDAWTVDTLCVLLDEHIGRFDPVYGAMETE